MREESLQPWQKSGFGLYIHWPFCQSKCPYCDFNSHVVDRVDQNRWLLAYQNELRRAGEETQGRVLKSIFFGGGTPSLMPASTVAGILDTAGKIWTFANDIEITLEANPTSVEAKRFHGFRSAGVNRVSIGVQALNDEDLRRLGRLHSVKEALAAIDLAQSTFSRVSFDLIYARQDQSIEAWEEELNQALSMGTEHLSLYQLTVEPETVFGERYKRGKLRGLPDEDLSADMYLTTQSLCDSKQMFAYEVSNHAKVGAESRHNLIYWKCGDYVGVGPGAHGRLTDASGARFATECPKAPGHWLQSVENNGHGENLPREQLSLIDQAREKLLMGLRLVAGFDQLEELKKMGLPLSAQSMIDLEAEGLINCKDSSIETTLSGRLLLNAVIAKLAP
jgi:putative oxygen-independent coproporphyrinogen III oxidase